MESSSSEEDESERTRFAEITGIVDKDVSNAQHIQFISSEVHSAKTSLRKCLQAEEEWNMCSAELTPECRRHVAKKLSSFLDSCLQEDNNCSTNQESATSETGILLFHSSKKRILEVGNSNLKKASKKVKKPTQEDSSSESSDEDDIARFAEAAVCGQSIIDNGLHVNNTRICTKSEGQSHFIEDTANSKHCLFKKEKTKKQKKKKKELEKPRKNNEDIHPTKKIKH